MSFDSIRRIVSGKKSRLTDSEVGVDLDLAYITDRIIVMGYPASGIASLYRNSRKDVKRWLDARHGEHYRIYNFCPRTENEYDGSYFQNRVRRFPFPDHHPPPLSMIPLFVRDIDAFLNADPSNVAVIHCKAGKGRSGTMTICYLMTLAALPTSPHLAHNPVFKSTNHDFCLSTLPTGDTSLFSEIVSQSSPPTPLKALLAPSVTATSKSTANDGHISTKTENSQSVSGHLSQPHVGISISDRPGENPRETAPDSLDAHVTKGPGGSSESIFDKKSDTLETNDVGNACNRPQDSLGSPIEDEQHFSPQEDPTEQNKNTTEDELIASMANRILALLKFHTMRRMADPESTRYGVSIPSQRRWIRYWGEVLLGRDARTALEACCSSPEYVEIRWIKVYVSDTVNYAKIVKSKSKIAVQLAHYKDSYIDDLEFRERQLLESGFHPQHQPTSGRLQDQAEAAIPEKEIEWDDSEELISTVASFGQESASQDLEEDTKLSGSGDTVEHQSRIHKPPESLSVTRAPTESPESTFSIVDGQHLTFEPSELEEQADLGPCRLLRPVRLYPKNSSKEHQKIKGSKAIREAGGVRIGARREVLLRIVLGSTGSKHVSLMPDVTLLGYLWFLPTFHRPLVGRGSLSTIETVLVEDHEGGPIYITRFPRAEIDFLNAANVAGVEVGWKSM